MQRIWATIGTTIQVHKEISLGIVEIKLKKKKKRYVEGKKKVSLRINKSWFLRNNKE